MRTPPVSSAALYVRPKSLREISVLASKPARLLPNGSVAMPMNSVARTTERVTPLIVRSPVTAKSSPEAATEVEVNVQTGFFSTSQKSALLRWPSRSGLPVLMDAASSSALTEELSMSSPTVTTAVGTARLPRTLEMPAWRTVKVAEVWVGSAV
jgi:hypothetical protein